VSRDIDRSIVSVRMETFYDEKSNVKYKEQRVGKRDETSQIMLEYRIYRVPHNIP